MSYWAKQMGSWRGWHPAKHWASPAETQLPLRLQNREYSSDLSKIALHSVL